MAHTLVIHPQNPEARLIRQAAQCLLDGGVIVYPTDSTYALGCHMGDKNALERIRKIRQLTDKHNLTLMCADLSAIATYAKVSNSAYRLLKAYTPGPYTFILDATAEVPRRLMHPKRKTIGLRVPANAVSRALLEAVGEPLMSTSLIMPGDDQPLSDIYDIEDRLGKHVDLIIDSGSCGLEPSTVIDLVDGIPVVIRTGLGDPAPFL
ncbi:MAG: L-threonylcarbamoyladenylate synthase [Pseudohongiella sp.]|jgi:tRNA threonylcarbamoyl adenosine modification protein (Sua5/YciO/YrdC/YwlC family)|nr:L-threonylcarbamoyladenylate synthase [Pseudohongiella sp.]MDP1757037.1 L-threonylcarbamoyladenylate synthase [Pseudohongiella sp.]MDP2286281.1 L-threonylcarbamoyladenylate synthase [Pseudohongiella sp.]MDP3518795.1 L-threonylcarbamoyladenylate synthase [Pseudohongiella sp.]